VLELPPQHGAALRLRGVEQQLHETRQRLERTYPQHNEIQKPVMTVINLGLVLS